MTIDSSGGSTDSSGRSTPEVDSTADVLVIGAGLAGLTAGLELADDGYDVVVLEARAVVGGRTSSWDDDGMPVESGLHRVLGVYSAFPKLLERADLDPDEVIVWDNEVEIRVAGGPSAVIGLAPLFEPGATLASIDDALELLPAMEWAKVAKFLATGLKDYFANPEGLDQASVFEYAKKSGLSDDTIHRFLVPLTSGIFFIPPERYSAHALFGLMGPYLERAPLLRVGSFRGGMTEVMARPVADAIVRRGGRVLRDTPVERLVVDEGSRVIGAVSNGTAFRARFVILAASLRPAQSIVRRSFDDPAVFDGMLKLPTMPVVTFQLELDRPARDADRVTFGPGTSWASFAEQSRTTFPGTSGRLSIILTPPERFLGMQADDILDVVLSDGRELGIDLYGHVIRHRSVELPDDFYSLEPGNQHLRPAQETSVPGLALAGDYTRQEHLGTMEGAVVSGRRAADLARESLRNQA